MSGFYGKHCEQIRGKSKSPWLYSKPLGLVNTICLTLNTIGLTETLFAANKKNNLPSGFEMGIYYSHIPGKHAL